mgnify:CR=1 FL=1
MAAKRKKKPRLPRRAADPVPAPLAAVPAPQPGPRPRRRTVAGTILGFIGALIETKKPKLEPGETELMPLLRMCPTCGWQAGEECRWDIRCPRCDTFMPYAGSKIIGADGRERSAKDPLSGGLFDPPTPDHDPPKEDP